MELGLVLPTTTTSSTREGIEAAAKVAEDLGWHSVWTTDHVIVDRKAAREYGRIYEAVLTLA